VPVFQNNVLPPSTEIRAAKFLQNIGT